MAIMTFYDINDAIQEHINEKRMRWKASCSPRFLYVQLGEMDASPQNKDIIANTNSQPALASDNVVIIVVRDDNWILLGAGPLTWDIGGQQH